MENDIKIEGLNVSFSDKGKITNVVKDVSCTFKSGKITGLIGESGSGKSVLGMSILGLLAPTAVVEGTCEFMEKDLYHVSEDELLKIRGTKIALIPQNPTESLNPIIRIAKQMDEAVLVHSKDKVEEAAFRRRVLLEKFGFTSPDDIASSYSFQLSGGMNQRVISAMGLMNSPMWVIADEPTKGLDAILRRQVYKVLKEISETETDGMIVITHDIALAGALCDDLMVLYKGMILEQGKTSDIIYNPIHPYTKGLLASLPENGLNPIRRADPNLVDKTAGCPFAPRCEKACDKCFSSLPPRKNFDDGREVRCFNL